MTWKPLEWVICRDYRVYIYIYIYIYIYTRESASEVGTCSRGERG